MISLRPHQEKSIVELRESLRKHRSVLLRAATGFGKTVVAAFMLQTAASKDKRSIFTVHRQELIDQTCVLFDEMGIRYGVIAAGYAMNPLPMVQIASIDTLRRRLDKVKEPALVVCDECHHCAAKSWSETLAYFSSAKIVGLSATPRRLDNKGLDHIFQSMVDTPSTQWLIDNKFLAPFRAFAPPPPDFSQVHIKMGDYDQKELEEIMDKPKITGDAVSHYLKLCNGMRAVVFATSIKHSKHIADTFNQAGVAAAHIDGKMHKDERKKYVKAFRNNEIKVITNCSLISEGFDLDAMEVAILLRPTKSLSLFLQQVGRALRYKDGKTAFILDHAGLIQTHGLPTDDFEWSLSGKKKKKKSDKSEVPLKICPSCYCAHAPAFKTCPSCGFKYEVKSKGVEHVEGDLHEINLDTWRKTAPYKKVIGAARTREELEAIGKARGYKRGWAFRVMQEREAKRAAQ